MNILIIGGTGLISTSISRQLIEAGHNLTLFNRGQTEPRLPGDYQWIKGDRNDFASFEEKMAQAGPFDCVIDMDASNPTRRKAPSGPLPDVRDSIFSAAQSTSTPNLPQPTQLASPMHGWPFRIMAAIRPNVKTCFWKPTRRATSR